MYDALIAATVSTSGQWVAIRFDGDEIIASSWTGEPQHR